MLETKYKRLISVWGASTCTLMFALLFIALIYNFNHARTPSNESSNQSDLLSGDASGVKTVNADTIPTSSTSPATTKSYPARLIIPKIKVDAPIDEVGITKTGAMGTPKGPSHAGWLDARAIPGATGTAVIDGHRGWTGHIPAVFDDLHLLKAGDMIYVKNDQGTIIPFIVRRVKSYSPDADASEVFGADATNGAYLDLITCEGVWIPSKKIYSQRLVVFAEKKYN